MIRLLFWLMIFVIFYIYIGYPFVIYVVSSFVNRKVNRKDIEPMVTVLITAYNEEKSIKEKIENTLSSDYPNEKLEVLVSSDGSTDRTDDIVKGFTSRNVKLVRVEGRKGKTNAQNEAVQYAKGEIIVFSDATTIYDRKAIRNIVRNFYDDTVGCVSGRLRYVKNISSDVSIGTVSYWEYEVFIRKCQSRIWSLTGATGAIYAARKRLYRKLPADIISDLVEPLEILSQGYRVVFEPEAVALEETFEQKNEEMNMRIRVVTRAMTGFMYMKNLFNLFKHPYLFFQIISHKVLRWFFFAFASLLIVTNLFLITEIPYGAILIMQLTFYSAAITGYILTRFFHKSYKILSLPFYFCLIHFASILSFLEFIRGRKVVTWEPTR